MHGYYIFEYDAEGNQVRMQEFNTEDPMTEEGPENHMEETN